MPLTPKARQHLKAKAHKLKPIILLGKEGLTPAVTAEINRALNDHELIKIRFQTTDRELRRSVFKDIAETNQAELVQVIGSIGVVFRAKVEK